MRRTAILVAFLATGALSVPTGGRWDAKCAKKCDAPFGDGAHVTFQSGRTHVYDYSSDVVTTLAGATDEASRLHVTATAEITANSGCDLTLQLRDISLQDSDPKDANNKQPVDNMDTFGQELQRWPLHFSYQNGRIDQLCANPDEPVWVLNFKRGVLSSLVTIVSPEQIGDSVVYEDDISGMCKTEYSVSTRDSPVLITKQKDLLACMGRGHLISSLQSTPYRVANDVQSLPLIKSSLECEQKVSEKRLVSAVCRESHMFKPFSQGENGAVTHTTVRMTERTIRDAGKWFWQSNDAEMPTTSTTLLFDHTDAELTQQNRVPAAAELLNQLQEKTSDNVRPDVPRIFTRLVRMLRHFNEEGLTQLDAQLEADSAAKRYFVDALPLAGTAPALALMRDMILRGSVTDETTDRWMTSLAFVHEPTGAMVAAVAPLLEERNARRQTLLGVSSLVHHYCKRNAACTEEASVRSVVAQLERALGSGCRAVSEDEEVKMLTALKALGNAGRLVDGIATLRSCFEDDDNSMEVRLAAISAFRRMPCSTVSDSGLMNTFANSREDTEVRIAAYLGVMQCASRQVIDKVQEVLSAETVNQVSSFVWSHLTNMQETNDPTRSYMKMLLFNVDLAKKFSTDMTKFSRFFEKTMFFESMNAGATVDANVVFTPDSYMPKSGMFNLTVDLFGEAFNLLEVGGRVEGLEDFSESMFGDNGIYPQEAISQIMKTMRGRQDNALSGRRIQSPKASAYMKIFGNELQFGKYDSLKELVASMGAKNPLDFLQKLAKDMDWTENYQFLDSAYTVSTIAGFPFTLKATGTATVSLKTGGSFDVQSWDSVNIDGHIKPSAAVEIMSEMLVDAHVAHTGLKMNTNLHTSTILDGHAVMNGGKLVSVRINMPRDKVEVLDVNTRFHSVFRNKARKLEMYTDNRFELRSCSDKYISTDLLGINFCADVSYSRGTPALPSCLFSGPLTARFTVEKADTLKAFEFEYHHANKAGVRKSSLVIDTVGSAIDRRISADYSIDFENNELKAGFYTPIKSMDVSGTLDLAGRTKRADVSLKMDGRELFGVTSSLAVEDTDVVTRYSPSLSIRATEGELGNFQGNLIASKDKHKYNADLAITKVFQTPIMLKVSFNEADGTYTVATSMKSFVLDGNMKGTFRVAGDNLLIQTNTEYTFMNGKPQTIGINSKMSQSEGDDKKTYRLFVDTKFSALPMLDCQLTAERSVVSDGCQTSVVLRHADRSYQLSSAMQHVPGEKIDASVGFVAQHWNVDFQLTGSMDTSKDNKWLVAAGAQLNREYFAKTKVGIDYKNAADGFHYGVKTELALPASTYTVNTGIGMEESSGHLRVVAKHETNEQVKEVALVAALTYAGDELDGELTFSMPHYPRYELSTRLVPGTDGLYMARARAQAGQSAYTLGAELKTAQQPMELDLLFERPGSRRMSARLTTLVVGDRPEVTVDLRFGRRITAVLAGNFYPSENTGNFEIFWNKDVDETEKASVEVLLREMDVSASLKYPGREVKLVGGLHSDGWTADLQYAPGRVIRAMGNIPSTGAFFSISVNTPIEGFSTMSLTYTKTPDVDYNDNRLNFEVIGRLEEQEARLVGRVLLDQAIETKLEMFTPLPGWEKSLLSFRYFMDGHSFEARVLAAKNDDQIALGGTFEMFQQEVFKISSALDLALPTDLFRKGKVGFDLKFAENSLDSGALVQWKTTQEHELSLTLTSQHSVGPETHIDSVMTLHTPCEGFETMSSHLKIDYRWKNLNALLNFKHANTKVFNVELLYSTSDFSHNGKFIFNCAKCPGFELLYRSSYENGVAFIASASSHWEGKETSLSYKLDSTNAEPGVTKSETLIALVLPIEPSQYSIKHIREMDFNKRTIFEHLEGNAGDKKVATDVNAKWNIKSVGEGETESMSLTGSGELTTPFQGWETAAISHTSKVTKLTSQPSYRGYTKYVNKDGKTIAITDSMDFEDSLNWQVQREVVSNSRWVSSATHAIRISGHPSSIQLTMDSETDGKAARFEYSHNLSKFHYSVSLSGKWFGGVTRGLQMAVRNADEAIYPSIDVTYDEDKTLRIYGSITKSLEKGQSSVTLEAPFTERAVLSVSHDLDKKKFTVDYLHGEKRYTVDMDVTIKNHLGSDAKLAIKFVSPRSCMGEGSIVLKYDLDNELKLKGMITRNDWELSMKSRLGMEKGHLAVNTPYPGYTLLSVDYLYKGDEGEIRLKREENQVLMVISRVLSSDTRTYNMRINTPYSGYETITLSINKPLNENRFNAEYQRGRQTSISATTEYDFSGPLFFASIEAQSSLEGFSTSALHLSYNLFSQTAKFVLSKEHNKIEANVVAELSPLFSKLSVEYFNTLVDLRLPQQLSVTGMYNIMDERKSLELALIKGAEKFLLNAEARASDVEEAFLTINIATPIDGYESAKFDARLGCTSANVLAKLELSKNEEIFKAIFEKTKSVEESIAYIELHSPYEAYRLTRLAAEYVEKYRTQRHGYAKLVAERNADKYEIKGSAEYTSDDALLLALTTPFTGIEQLSLEAGQVDDGAGTTTRLVLTRNQDQIRVVTNTEFSWTKSVISFESSSPFPEARSLGVSVMYDIQNEQKTCSAILTRNDKRYEMNAFGVMKRGAATGVIELKSSTPGWENLKYQATYDLNTDEKMMEISYERNGVKKVIASRGSYDGETAYIDVVTPLEGYETMGLNGRYVSRRGKREVGYDSHVNDHRHRLHVLYERNGLESATLKIESPIEGMSLIQVDVRSQLFPDGAGYYINTNRDGKRSSIEIRYVKDDSSVGVDMSVKSYIEGLENLQLAGNVVNTGRKKSFSLKSIRGSKTAEISGEVEMRRSSGNGNLKIQLPIEEWGDVDASFEYQLGQTKSFQLSSIRGGVTREYSGSLQYSDSSITVSLNTPFNGFKKLSADASRTKGPDGTISAEISLMRGNRKIEITYDYKVSTTAGSALAKVTTPYDGFRVMQTSVEYYTGPTSRSLEFRAKRDDREWHLQTSRTWEEGTDSGTLLLETPLAEARKIKFSRAFNIKNLAEMTYEAAYERNGRAFSLSGTGSIKRKGKKTSFDVTITTPLEIGNIGAKISYDFVGTPRTINAKVNAGERHATLDASFGLTDGSISLVTTNEMLPKLDVTYAADVSAKKRDVKATLVLYDGRKLQLDYLADYTAKNKANGHVYLESTTFGTRKLTWDYAVPSDDFSGNLRYISPNGKLKSSITVDGKRYVQRRVVIKNSIESEIYTSTWAATLRYNTKNGFVTKNKLVYNGKAYILNFQTKEVKGKGVVSLTYDGQILKGIKIDGTWTLWTLPGSIEQKKEFNIKYERGSRTASLKGWFQASPGGKSGTADIEVETPFEEVSSLHVKTSWDFVLPNRILKIDYNRNAGKTFSLSFIGSRQDENGKPYGKYNLVVTTPPFEVKPGVSLYDIRVEVAFDLRYGHMYKMAWTSPYEEEVKIDIKVNGNVRTVDAHYHFRDPKGLLDYMPSTNVQFDFKSKRTDRRTGPKIDLVLNTSYEGFEEIEVNIDVTKGRTTNTLNVDYRRGSRKAHMTAEVENSPAGGSVSFNVQTPIEGFEDASLSGSYQKEPSYSLTLDYSRGDKFVKMTSSLQLDTQRGSYGQLQGGSIDARLKLDSYITMPVDLLITLDGSMEAEPRRSGQYKLVATLNDQTFSVDHQVSRVEAGRRTARVVILTPYKSPFKRITYNADVSLASNKAAVSLEYGRKKVELDVSWFAGEGRQYGAEIRLSTPYKAFQAVELDAKATLQPRGDVVDVLVHYRRGQKMVHVTGTVKPFAVDLHFETPTFGNFGIKGGFHKVDGVYNVEGLYVRSDGTSIGGHIAIKPYFKANDMQVTVDIHTPAPGWERLGFDIAYTNIENSNIMRVAFESPMTKRVELSFELTNLTDGETTDFRAGVTTNYLGNAFTFKTTILRDTKGMKYELEIESPFHVLPSFKITGRR